MRVRNPNTGPYVVSWYDHQNVKGEQEHQLWTSATHHMRRLLIENKLRISVRFV